MPHKFGEEHHNSILTEEMTNNIKNLLKNSNLSQSEIANLSNISQPIVSAINRGIIHKSENENYPIRQETPYHLNIKDVDDIKWLLQNSTNTVYEIAEFYNVSASTIKHINSGRNYHDDNLNYPLKIRTYCSRNSQPVETILAKRSTFTIDT